MAVVVVVGGQWGDEGKGKIVDLLAEKATLVARCQGGNNAGHTVINDLGEFRLHLVPSGLFYPATTCIIGNGTVVDPQVLLGEIGSLTSRGVAVAGRLFVSPRAHVIMPYHILLDKLEEESRGGRSIGTTGRGIGPAYADKIARSGIRMGDLLDRDLLWEKITHNLNFQNKIISRVYGGEPVDPQVVHHQYLEYGQRLSGYITETLDIIQAAVASGHNILLEGAQGAMLDIDHGTYPFVTSSSPVTGGACTGVGLGPTQVDRAIGVFKAYVTRVGAGPFPTELTDHIGDEIRERAHEYGTTTFRPRRCGWFDAVVGRYSAQINGLDTLAITRLDILDTLETIKVCTGYHLDGKPINYPPANLADFARCEPVYEEHRGWLEPTGTARTFGDLPRAARDYVTRLAELLVCRIGIVSVGAGRDQTVVVDGMFD